MRPPCRPDTAAVRGPRAAGPGRPRVPRPRRLSLLLLALTACGPGEPDAAAPAPRAPQDDPPPGAVVVAPDPGRPPAEPEAPVTGIVLVTFDTTRGDRFGYAGHAAASTPVVDALAAGGVVFLRAQATAPQTLPSHASLFTGLVPPRHGARHNGTHRLPDDVPTLAGTLADAGWATAAVVSAVVLDDRFGLDAGFEHYDDDLSAGATHVGSYRQTTADLTTDRALDWLDDHGDRPYLLWVHYFDPHRPFTPPPRSAARTPDPYDGEIAFVDEQLGRLLDAVRARPGGDQVLVAVTADHGEALGEHGESSHGYFAYDATLHVPLLLHHPSLAAGRRLAGTVSLVDVAPTLLELAGVPPTPDLDGRSLAARVRTTDPAPAGHPAYAEAVEPRLAYGLAPLDTVADDRGRYVLAPRPELYLLPDDPGETRNVLAADTAGADERARLLVRELASALEAALARGQRDVLLADGGAGPASDPALLDDLAALGYVTAPSTAPFTGADPKDHVDEVELLHRARELVAAGRFAPAAPMLTAVLEELPGARDASSLLLQVHVGLGAAGPATELAERLVALPDPRLEDLLTLGRMRRALGRPDWAGPLERAATRFPHEARPWVELAEGRFEQGDLLACRAAALSALRADRDDPTARLLAANLARTFRREGDPGAALSLAEEVQAVAPGDVLAHLEAAAALHVLGVEGPARDALDLARRADAGVVRERVAEDPDLAELAGG